MKKLKDIIKKNPEPARGTNYVNPGQLGQYSATSQISEGALEQYLLSKGINPKFISLQTKIAHSKSNAFLKWKNDHSTFREEIELDEDLTTSKSGSRAKVPGKDAGEPRSKDKDAPVLQRAADIEKAKKHYTVKTGPGALKKENVEKKVNKVLKVVKGEGSQTTQLTPESKQMLNCNHSPAGVMCETHGMKDCSTLKESNKSSALERFRKAADEREKKHKDIEARMKAQHQKGKENMKGAIDRLAAHMNKEELELDEASKDNPRHPMYQSDPSLYKKTPKSMTKQYATHAGKFFSNKDTVDYTLDYKKTDKEAPRYKNEDIMDPQAAIAKVPDTDPSITERKRQMSKSARMIKALYKKKGMVKEDLYDHEKSDKSVATYGKKPKFDKADKKDSEGETKPSAAATLTGGTTLTGAKRDDVEIDPMMRNRPGQPDVTKKDDKKKDDKKEDKKKDK